MKYCIQCDNMYYIGLNSDDSNKLTYYCRNCGYKYNTITNEGVCVLKSELKNSGNKFHHIINQYTKLDPTLPRIRNLKCPNAECKYNKEDKTAEVIYVRYDDDNLKYLYICVECDTTWKTN